MQPGYALKGTVPVFAFPPAVNFYLGDQKTYKQIITLYNPYDSPVRFKLLCTTPDKYQVVNPMGYVKAFCQIDILVRHIDLTNANCNITDKFRIELLDFKTKQVIGKKDITATLHSGIPDTKENDNESTEPMDKVLEWDSQSNNFGSFSRNTQGRSNSTNPVVILTGFVCIIALLMPNEGETSTIPIQLSLNLKLVLSYVLGLVTMVIMRS